MENPGNGPEARHDCRGFNGATVGRPWRTVRRQAKELTSQRRGPSMEPQSEDRGERQSNARQPARCSGASMGPQSEDRGEQPGIRHEPIGHAAGHSGAGAPPDDPENFKASMEPQSEDRGELAASTRSACLQRSFHGAFNGATVGRPGERKCPRRLDPEDARASMEPQSEDRGELQSQRDEAEAIGTSLQWSHSRKTVGERHHG